MAIFTQVTWLARSKQDPGLLQPTTPSAPPPTARAPFSQGRSSLTWDLERPTLRDFLLRKLLTGIRQPSPKETQRGQRSQEQIGGWGSGPSWGRQSSSLSDLSSPDTSPHPHLLSPWFRRARF